MHVCTHVGAHVCTHVCTHVSANDCTYVSVHVCTHVAHMSACMPVSMTVCMSVRMSAAYWCACLYTCRHACLHAPCCTHRAACIVQCALGGAPVLCGTCVMQYALQGTHHAACIVCHVLCSTRHAAPWCSTCRAARIAQHMLHSVHNGFRLHDYSAGNTRR